MSQIQDGQFTKQSAMDLLGWLGAADLPEVNRARMYYDFQTNMIHVIDSQGNELLVTSGAGVVLLPLADQVISGPFNLVLNGGGLRFIPVAFSALPAASASNEGMIRAVNDSTTNTWGATITGLGAFHVLAYSDGTNWTVAAK